MSMRWIYLSPHLDDAVLSCGGIIAKQRKAGIVVEIWNWMSGIPTDDLPISDLARSVHAGWEFDTAIEAFISRLAEDRLAASRVDAFARYFGFLDCIYRLSDNGEFLYPKEIFVPPHFTDDKLVTKIAEKIAENLRPDDILVSPLTIGNHPDHVIVRRAAEQIGHPLRYYADIPYSIWYPDQFDEMTKSLEAETHLLPEEDLHTWQEAVSAYASQLAVLFGGEEMMKKALRLYWQKLQGIHIFT